MDSLLGFGELSMGSRLKRVSDYMMRETQIVYDTLHLDFDPYLFPIFNLISNYNGITNSEINCSLKITQPATTQAINKLLKKDLIVLKEDKSDKRKKIIILSNKGKSFIKQLSPVWQSIEQTVKEYTSFQSISLLEHLNILEHKFELKSFSQTILEHLNMNNLQNFVEVIPYNDAYKNSFYSLNIEWLETFFYLEPYDKEVLSNPKQYILDKGGHIFFAKLNDEIVGTVALMPKDGVYELTKMAVSPKHRGYKIGQQLMQHCINFASEIGLQKLILYSNTRLENAIYIYRKYGFIEIPVEENSPYDRCNIKMEIKLPII